MNTRFFFTLYLQVFACLLGAFTILVPLVQAFKAISEKALARVMGLIMSLTALLSACLLISIMGDPAQVVSVDATHGYQHLAPAMELRFVVNGPSAAILLLANVIIAAVGNFSFRYLHREQGYVRFFFFYTIFFAGINLAMLAASFDLLAMGWEMVGISSVMLIGFFFQRQGPRDHARLVFNLYRVADLALMMLLLLLSIHMQGHHASLSPLLTNEGLTMPMDLSPTLANTAICLLVLACAVKAAQVPFTPWLAYAMEGPTSSSAIFYGALSVHLGPLLLLRLSHLWQNQSLWAVALCGIGGLSFLTATLAGRARSDVKSQLAYASAAQVGFIFVEIGLGWHSLAYAHIIGHMLLRTWQFLSSPAYLQIRSKWQKAHAQEVASSFAWLGDSALGHKLYAWALHDFKLLSGLRQLVAAPLWYLATGANRVEEALEKKMGATAPAPNTEAYEAKDFVNV